MIALTVLVVAIAAAIILAGWTAIQAPRWAAAAYHRITRPPAGNGGAHERRRVYDRTLPPAGDKAQREAAYAVLGDAPAPPDIYPSMLPPRLPRVEPGPPIVASLTDVPARRKPSMRSLGPPFSNWDEPPVTVPAPDVDADVAEWQHILAPAERLATDTDVRAIAGVLPAWVIEALNGHDGVDAAVESIVARAVTP